MAFSRINAAHRDHRRGAEVELLRSKDGSDDHVAHVADSTVGAEDDAVAEVVD